VETLVYIVIGIIAIGIFCLYVQIIVASYLTWSGANRRARELLRSVLTDEQYYQLMRKGYVDIPSQCVQERTYRVPQAPGLVAVMGTGEASVESLSAAAGVGSSCRYGGHAQAPD
jgi:hypothetical protein